jgi:hypothetical protein
MNEAEPMMLWLPSLTGLDKLEALQGPPLASFLVLRNVTRRFSSSRSFLFPSSQSLHPNLPPAHATLTNVTPYLHQARWRRLDLLICIPDKSFNYKGFTSLFIVPLPGTNTQFQDPAHTIW